MWDLDIFKSSDVEVYTYWKFMQFSPRKMAWYNTVWNMVSLPRSLHASNIFQRTWKEKVLARATRHQIHFGISCWCHFLTLTIIMLLSISTNNYKAINTYQQVYRTQENPSADFQLLWEMDTLLCLDITCMQIYKDTHDMYYISTDPTTALLLHVCMHQRSKY